MKNPHNALGIAVLTCFLTLGCFWSATMAENLPVPATGTPQNSKLSVSMTDTPEYPKETFIEHCTALTIRSGPSMYYPALEYIGVASAVEVLGPCKNGWRPVRYGKIEGWVYAYYLIGGCQ